MPRARTATTVLLVNWLIALSLYLLLFTNRSVHPAFGPYSAPYIALLFAGGLVLGGLTWLTWKVRVQASDGSTEIPFVPGQTWTIWPLFLGPFVVLLAILAVDSTWWLRRPWPLRVFSSYLLLDWALLWLYVLAGGHLSKARQALALLGIVMLAAGLQSLALATSGFGLSISGVAIAPGLSGIAVAAIASPARAMKVLTVMSACLGALLLGELLLRGIGLSAGTAALDDATSVRLFHHNPPPNSTFVWYPHPVEGRAPVVIEINSLGMRGPEKTGGPADILLLGDSFVQALQVPWEKTVGPLLDQRLGGLGRPPGAVVSHGVVGWSPLLEWNWYLKIGRRFKPKLVLLFFFWNDLWTRGDEVSDYRAVLAANGRPDHFDVPRTSRWLWYRKMRSMQLAEILARRAHALSLPRLLAARRVGAMSGAGQPALSVEQAGRVGRQLVGGQLPLTPAQIERLLTLRESELDPELRQLSNDKFWPTFRPLHLWPPGRLQAAATSEQVLTRFADDVRADGGRLVLVYVPNPLQLGPSECSIGRYFDRIDGKAVLPPGSGIQEWLRLVAERHAYELLDPTDAMRRYAKEEERNGWPSLYLRYDCHWSEAGQEFVARYLADWYRTRRDAALSH